MVDFYQTRITAEPPELTRRLFIHSVATYCAFASKSTASANAAKTVFSVVGKHHPVLIDPLPIFDKEQGRIILTSVAMPTDAKNCPVIIFSHGFGGDFSAFSNSAKFWASHGYIVIRPTHADSVRFSDQASARGRELNKVFSKSSDVSSEERRLLLIQLMEDPSYLQSRIADISYLAESIASGHGLDTRVHRIARRTKLGLAGHSFGAYVTQVVAGATISPIVRNAPTKLKKRFAAFLTISGQGAGRLGLSAKSFPPITAPLLQITGTRDFGADGETPKWRLQAFEESSSLHKYAAIVKDFRHRDFDPPIDEIKNASGLNLRGLQVAFFNAWLADDHDARAHLLDIAARSTPDDMIWFRTGNVKISKLGV